MIFVLSKQQQNPEIELQCFQLDEFMSTTNRTLSVSGIMLIVCKSHKEITAFDQCEIVFSDSTGQ